MERTSKLLSDWLAMNGTLADSRDKEIETYVFLDNCFIQNPANDTHICVILATLWIVVLHEAGKCKFETLIRVTERETITML